MVDRVSPPEGVMVFAQGALADLARSEASGQIQFVENGLVPHEVFTKRLKSALDDQTGDGETFTSIHHLLQEAKRAGIVSLSLVHTMMLEDCAPLIMSVTVEVREGDTHRVHEHEASPQTVGRVTARLRQQGVDRPWDPLPRHTLV